MLSVPGIFRNILLGEAGNDTVFAASSPASLVANNILDGGVGDDFVGVSATDNMLRGGAGNDFVGATGNDHTLDGGFGDDQLEAAAGHTGARFVYHAGYGRDAVTGFARHGGGGTDVIDIQGFGLASFAALAPFMAQSGSDTVITLNGADILTIRNVLPGGAAGERLQLRNRQPDDQHVEDHPARLGRERQLHHQFGCRICCTD